MSRGLRRVFRCLEGPHWPEPPRARIELKLLRELRTRLVNAIDEVTCVRDLEPLARRLDAVSAEIDDLAAMREPSGSPADVIAALRAERVARGQPWRSVMWADGCTARRRRPAYGVFDNSVSRHIPPPRMKRRLCDERALSLCHDQRPQHLLP